MHLSLSDISVVYDDCRQSYYHMEKKNMENVGEGNLWWSIPVCKVERARKCNQISPRDVMNRSHVKPIFLIDTIF